MQYISKRRGFTLIELLIVVAIIAILAAIAVPNFLEAQTRAKVSKAKADMRSMATAIESYYVDYNNYVRSTYEDGATEVWERYSSWSGTTEDNILDGGYFADLSTPVAYIANAYMEDPFSDAFNKAKYFRYTALGKNAITGFLTSRTAVLDRNDNPVLDDDGNPVYVKNGVAYDSSQSQIHAWVLWSIGPDGTDAGMPMIALNDDIVDEEVDPGTDGENDYLNYYVGSKYSVDRHVNSFDPEYSTYYFVQEIGENTSLTLPEGRYNYPTEDRVQWNWLVDNGWTAKDMAVARALGYMYSPANGTDSSGEIFHIGGGSVDEKNLSDEPSAVPIILQTISETAGN